jgi:hypothetical protein
MQRPQRDDVARMIGQDDMLTDRGGYPVEQQRAIDGFGPRLGLRK